MGAADINTQKAAILKIRQLPHSIVIRYNDVNNQQDTTFSFINLFKSALHVSGDKFARPQENFLII